jgi:selenide,water dikinase
VLAGLGRPDDAGAYRLSDALALVQTVDYFTPIVDDPRDFGRIAAANSLSDVYAMGARPLTALTLLGFPEGELSDEVVRAILDGGRETMATAGAAILGGHTVDDKEPKFGYAVTGVAHPERLLRKDGLRVGDALLLTKPIGVGVITTALKKAPETVPEELVRRVTETMAALNRLGAELPEIGVRAATDVTGFGLLGHAWEMAELGAVRLRIEAERVPRFPEARRYAEAGFFAAGSRRNYAFLEGKVGFAAALDEVERRLLADAVTSGGLLVGVAPERVAAVEERAAALGVTVAVIGRVVGDDGAGLEVV